MREKKLSGWRQLKKLQPVAMDPWRKSRLGFKILEIARGVGGSILWEMGESNYVQFFIRRKVK